ncbi:hypothetical protein BDZ89DRAFT_919181, partial [Hymenopellis radicata]
LSLKRYRLRTPIIIDTALKQNNDSSALTDYVKLRCRDVNNFWTSRTVKAVVAPSLCSPMILGLPF